MQGVGFRPNWGSGSKGLNTSRYEGLGGNGESNGKEHGNKMGTGLI